VSVDILDAQGRVVPTADNLVSFRITGSGTVDGVGNGNPSDLDPDKANQKHAFNGHCAAIIQSTDQPGTIRVIAESPGLKSAVISLRSSGE
jgi:beta-galactosidase